MTIKIVLPLPLDMDLCGNGGDDFGHIRFGFLKRVVISTELRAVELESVLGQDHGAQKVAE